MLPREMNKTAGEKKPGSIERWQRAIDRSNFLCLPFFLLVQSGHFVDATRSDGATFASSCSISCAYRSGSIVARQYCL